LHQGVVSAMGRAFANASAAFNVALAFKPAFLPEPV